MVQTSKLTPSDYERRLRDLLHDLNKTGAHLRLYRPKNGRYDWCISGRDTIGRSVKMGGTARWLFWELVGN